MNPNEDTEWNDILRAHGILPPKPSEDVEDSDDEPAKNPLEGKSLEELKELEEETLDDDQAIMKYRLQRMAEMRNSAIKMKSQTLLKSITKTEFVGEVTEASRSIPVVAFLYKADLPACRLMEQYLLDLASKYSGRTKFVKIIGNECIPGYPDRNLPTLLIYINGDLRVQQVGIERLGGMAMQQSDLERFLIKVGAVPRQNQDEDDSDLGSESDESD